jgi:hypothetical protein
MPSWATFSAADAFVSAAPPEVSHLSNPLAFNPIRALYYQHFLHSFFHFLF